MKTPSDKEDDRNQLRIENEVKKIKLKLEHGMDFSSAINKNTGKSEKDPLSELPPEVEGAFLDHVQQFEDAWQNAKRALVYDMLGKPAYKKVNDIPDSEISRELARIHNLLNSRSIEIDTICKVEDRELYRFITEELFMHETDDMMISGMTTHFIYEEFHPNHEHDITEHCKDIIKAIFNKKGKFDAEFLPLSKELVIKGKKMEQKKAVEKLELFREAYKSLKLSEFNITSISHNTKKGKVEFEISYTGVIEGSVIKKQFSGKGNFSLINKYDYWDICRISIPGVV